MKLLALALVCACNSPPPTAYRIVGHTVPMVPMPITARALCDDSAQCIDLNGCRVPCYFKQKPIACFDRRGQVPCDDWQPGPHGVSIHEPDEPL